MSQPFALDIRATMYPLMAGAAQGREVVRIESSGGRFLPGLDVVQMQRLMSGWTHATSSARCRVALYDISAHCFPSARCVDPLTLGTDATAPVRVERLRSPVHAVTFTAQPRTWASRRLGDQLSGLRRVLSTEPMRHVVGLRPRVVLPVEVVSARTSGDAEVPQLLVNPLRIASDYLRNRVGRQPFIDVLPSQPVRVQVRRFLRHATYLSPKKGGNL